MSGLFVFFWVQHFGRKQHCRAGSEDELRRCCADSTEPEFAVWLGIMIHLSQPCSAFLRVRSRWRTRIHSSEDTAAAERYDEML